MRSKRNRRSRPGTDLESLFFDDTGGSKADTKALQMCRQVWRRLDIALAGELEDPLLNGLWVQSVRPEPGGSALLVEVVSSTNTPVVDVLAHLNAARGYLRSEIAAAIHRKRTPYLRFVVVPPPALPDEEEPDDDG